LGSKDQFYIAFLSLLGNKYIYTKKFSRAKRREMGREGFNFGGGVIFNKGYF